MKNKTLKFTLLTLLLIGFNQLSFSNEKESEEKILDNYLQNNNCIVNGESIRKKYKYFNNNIYSHELSCNKSNLNNIKNTKDFFQLNGKFRYCLLISSGLKHNTTNLNKNIEIIYSCIGK